jgi:hypothetical protein
MPRSAKSPFDGFVRRAREPGAIYKRARLIHCKETRRPTKVALALEREVFLSGSYKALAFGAGPLSPVQHMQF